MDNESFEVNLIEGLTSEHDTEIEYESDREFELESDDFNLDQIIESIVKWATNATPILPLHKEQSLIDQVPTFELKVLPSHLKYQYLGEKEAFPVIIASHLTEQQEEDLLVVLRKNREAIGWTMADIKGISPSIVQHRIHLTEDTKPKRDPQRRLNPIMQEAVRAKILKLLVQSTLCQRK